MMLKQFLHAVPGNLIENNEKMAKNAFKMRFHTDRCIFRRPKYLQSILRPLIDLHLTWFVLEDHSFEEFSKQS